MDQITEIALFIGCIASSLYIAKSKVSLLNSEKIYTGGCHCQAVTFQVTAPKHLVAWNCNCSICAMKKNWHFIVPFSNFKILTGNHSLTEYKFNTGVARHMFCKHCGVQAFYRPRSNPDGCAVTLACVDPKQIESFEIRGFDGENWEDFYGASGIQKFSQPSNL